MTRVQDQIDRLLAHRAAEWVEALGNGGERERCEFDAWLRQSPLHAAHFLEIVALGNEVAALDRSQGEDVASILRRIAPRRKMLDHPAAGRSEPPGAARGRANRRRTAALAAGLLLGLGAWMVADRAPWRGETIDTTVGEQRSLTLADGSFVTLNTASQIRVEYSATQRQIALDAGEAVFKVARDAARPFEVRTRLATIVAVGTEFNVYQRPADTLVSVLEGRVRVTPPSGGTPAFLDAGEEARILPDGHIEKRGPADVARTLAWQQRRLSFEEAPLEEMVREFNRYSRGVQFRIEDVPPGAYHFGGVFDAYDIESLQILLSRESGLRVRREGAEIVIRPRTADTG